MEQRADLLAVGSMGHVQLLDPRRWAGFAGFLGLSLSAIACCMHGGSKFKSAHALSPATQQNLSLVRRPLPVGLRLPPQVQTLFVPERLTALCLIFTPRRNPEVRAVASPDDNQGVRSVQLTDHLLSFGTGRGKLFFWDLRAGGFVPTGETLDLKTSGGDSRVHLVFCSLFFAGRRLCAHR